MKPCVCRGLLSTANFLFDPLGFVAPVVLKARCIHHSLCQQEIEWNEPMPERELRKWEMWFASLSQLQHVAIPRCLGLSSCGDMQRCQFHYFADVSITAYGVVCFLHSVDNKNNIVCSFIMSKSHLAPLDKVSVSSLELMAAVLAIKLEMMVKKELRLDLRPSIFWTDSSIVLLSVRNDRKRFPMFVSRRLALICKHTRVANWEHVPSDQNPADLLSRGATAEVLDKTKMWLNGPDFLSKEPAAWPKKFIDCDGEVPLEVSDRCKMVNTLSAVTDCTPTECLLNQYFKSLQIKDCYRMVQKVSSVLEEQNVQSLLKTPHNPLTVAELREAEVSWVK